MLLTTFLWLNLPQGEGEKILYGVQKFYSKIILKSRKFQLRLVNIWNIATKEQIFLRSRIHALFYENIVFVAEFFYFLPILGWNILVNIIRL